MKSFKDYIKERMNLDMPKGDIPGIWFVQHNIPMVVRCTCCEMTMVSPSAWINEEGYTFCSDCAGASED